MRHHHKNPQEPTSPIASNKPSFKEPEMSGQESCLLDLYFDIENIQEVRKNLFEITKRLGLSEKIASDYNLAVHEACTNSIRHGGGRGYLKVWKRKGRLVSQVQDHGHIENPQAGKTTPELGQIGGHGLWLMNQLADLVEIASSVSGTTIRIHLGLDSSRDCVPGR